MALQGDLSEFPLTDIIQLVDLSKQTGGVHLQGRRGLQQIEGWLYFRDGKIIGAQAASLPPLEALYTFFTLDSGPFRFYDDRRLETPTISLSNEIIIMEGIMRQDAWANSKQQVPSLDLIPRLVPNPSTGGADINLESEEWRVLTMVNGSNTVGQIAQRSGLGEFRTCEIIGRLLESGLIAGRDGHPGETLAPEFERIAVATLGQSASQLLQEAYAQASIPDPLNATREQLLQVLDHFEAMVNRLFGAARATQVMHELRSRAEQVLS
jgi:hypothetical protein